MLAKKSNGQELLHNTHRALRGEPFIAEGYTMKTTYMSKDQNWNDGTTTYWFDVNGDTYGVVHGGESCNSKVVDCAGAPSDYYTADQFEITPEMIAE